MRSSSRPPRTAAAARSRHASISRVAVAAALVVAAASAAAMGACRAAVVTPLGPREATAAPSATATATASADAAPPSLETVPPSALCFTEGRGAPSPLAGALRIDAGGARAVVAGDRSHSAELAFTYRGPSTVMAPLADGELRRQIGIKLRAQDTCNVVYVMWHIEPTAGVAVSVKRNAGATKHGECGATGYDNLRPESSARAPAIERGAPHVLRADLDGTELRVTTDGIIAWRGHLPASASTFDGPAGLRTDNGTFDVELRTPNGTHARGVCP